MVEVYHEWQIFPFLFVSCQVKQSLKRSVLAASGPADQTLFHKHSNAADLSVESGDDRKETDI